MQYKFKVKLLLDNLVLTKLTFLKIDSFNLSILSFTIYFYTISIFTIASFLPEDFYFLVVVQVLVVDSLTDAVDYTAEALMLIGSGLSQFFELAHPVICYLLYY